MTIPTDFNDNATTIGSENIKHPIYTFRVVLDRLRNENVGPNTNSRSVNLLHPDMYDSSANRGRTNSANHQTQFSSFFPGLTGSENIRQNDDGTFTAYGSKAAYLKKTYVDIANPLLEITNDAPYTSA